MTKLNRNQTSKKIDMHAPCSTAGLHPSWLAFIRHCQELGFGEISQLKIQDGVPVMAEESIKKIKFN